MARWEKSALHGKRLAIERLCLVIFLLQHKDVCDAPHRKCDLRMFLAEKPSPHRKRLTEQRLGLFAPIGLDQQAGEIAKCGSDLRAFLALLTDRQCLAKKRLGSLHL